MLGIANFSSTEVVSFSATDYAGFCQAENEKQYFGEFLIISVIMIKTGIVSQGKGHFYLFLCELLFTSFALFKKVQTADIFPLNLKLSKCYR